MPFGRQHLVNRILSYRMQFILGIIDAVFLITRIHRSKNQRENVGVATLSSMPTNPPKEFLYPILTTLSSVGFEILVSIWLLALPRNLTMILLNWKMRLSPVHFRLLIYATETIRKKGSYLWMVWSILIAKGILCSYTQRRQSGLWMEPQGFAKAPLERESEVAQSCPTLCDPIDCSLPGSSIYGIFQARVLEWVAISFSRGSSRPRNWIWVSHIVGRHFTVWATREVSVCPIVKVNGKLQQAKMAEWLRTQTFQEWRSESFHPYCCKLGKFKMGKVEEKNQIYQL